MKQNLCVLSYALEFALGMRVWCSCVSSVIRCVFVTRAAVWVFSASFMKIVNLFRCEKKKEKDRHKLIIICTMSSYLKLEFNRVAQPDIIFPNQSDDETGVFGWHFNRVIAERPIGRPTGVQLTG